MAAVIPRRLLTYDRRGMPDLPTRTVTFLFTDIEDLGQPGFHKVDWQADLLRESDSSTRLVGSH
jgi:hypothetical protein